MSKYAHVREPWGRRAFQRTRAGSVGRRIVRSLAWLGAMSVATTDASAAPFDVTNVYATPCLTASFCVGATWSLQSENQPFSVSYPLALPVPDPSLWRPVSAQLIPGGNGGSILLEYLTADVFAFGTDLGSGLYWVRAPSVENFVKDHTGNVLGSTVSPHVTVLTCLPQGGTTTTFCSDGNVGGRINRTFGPDELAWTQHPLQIGYHADPPTIPPYTVSTVWGGNFLFVGEVALVYERHVCANGLDDDGDGLADYPADPGCGATSGPTEQPECSDGLDNDSDGWADAPADWTGCTGPADGSEKDTSANAWQCDDGIDNDGDGLVDHRIDGNGDQDCVNPATGLEAASRGCGLAGIEAVGAILALRRARRAGARSERMKSKALRRKWKRADAAPEDGASRLDSSRLDRRLPIAPDRGSAA